MLNFLKNLSTDEKDEIIMFLCGMLTDNVEKCPANIYKYENDKKLCGGYGGVCEGRIQKDERKCWLKLALNDTGKNVD